MAKSKNSSELGLASANAPDNTDRVNKIRSIEGELNGLIYGALVERNKLN